MTNFKSQLLLILTEYKNELREEKKAYKNNRLYKHKPSFKGFIDWLEKGFIDSKLYEA